MAKENAYIFLSEESLEELERSKGAKLLIHYPEIIESYKKEMARLEAEKEPILLEFEGIKKGYEDLFHLPITQRVFDAKKIREEKQEYVNTINKMAKELADIDTLIGDYNYYIIEASHEINVFVHNLHNINLESQDVIEAYNEIKARLEAKAKGIDATALTVEQQPEVASAAEPAKPARPKEQRLSPKEKFERRLARTKEIQEQGQRQPQ